MNSTQKLNKITPTFLNTLPKIKETQLRGATIIVTFVRKWKPNPLPVAIQKEPKPQQPYPHKTNITTVDPETSYTLSHANIKTVVHNM